METHLCLDLIGLEWAGSAKLGAERDIDPRRVGFNVAGLTVRARVLSSVSWGLCIPWG